ncbi:DNA mismatch repair endonuclease MutL [Oceanirhabdus sp. W0125-5]|uniref:DNA mismatch repair endonuclease MutL n=1 Tax=Oceanirhabdus sp. W0125-5 TaxID=2999116 RepID=UPI0022F2CF7A|nr:DNA mismatch repair endonuclease MutL [Oceanirhabdus sp. W0125-5]WBW95110.1 DNA mismatch repair endonuclease MutL [Oceanirhabdus sp. W0125-5]
MKRIQVLDKHTCNQIAAGEVVERPSSVVKELVENSIDAKSTNIRVEIIEGGHTSIKIIDDGVGIHPDDVEKAFTTHATSKISKISDVYSITTLGFRGEALPSIASVSKTKLSSKCEEIDFGKEIIIDAGVIKSVNEIGRGRGTTIEVEDLFFNVPARQKFLKSSSKEGAAVNDILMRLALSNPQVSFTFVRDSKKVFSTSGSGDVRETIRNIYGKETYNNIISFENQNEYSTIYGFIGNESISRGSRNRQTIYVNGRYIKNRLIATAVERAFKSFLTVNKFPFFVLFINISPDIIDVNIHPTKSEIKFKEDRGIFKLVFDGVHEALKQDLQDSFIVEEEIMVNNNPLKLNEEKLSNLTSTLSSLEKLGDDMIKISVPIDLKKNENTISNQKIFSNETKINENRINDTRINDSSINQDNSYTYTHTPKKDITLNEDTISHNEPFLFKSEIKKEVIQETYIKDDDLEIITEKKGKFPMPKVIGQYDKTYILAEINKTLFIIDQHAAHEKILFEKYSTEIDEHKVVSQLLAVPVLVDLTPDEMAVFLDNIELFNKAGFNCETFGGNTISIREIPELLKSINVKETFMTFLEDIMNLGNGTTSKIKYNTIARNACRKAIKANDVLNMKEMEHLLEELRFINEPFTCPHGRPTIIKFTTHDIEKLFKRIQ